MGDGARVQWCAFDGCLNPPREGGKLCWAHSRRAARNGGKPQRVQGQLRPWALVMEASIALAECDTDDDRAFAAAEFRLRWAVERWFEARRQVGRGPGEPPESPGDCNQADST